MGLDGNLAVFLRAMQAVRDGDAEVAAEVLDPDATMIVRGRSAISGTFRGFDEIVEIERRIHQDLTNGTIAGVPEIVVGDESNVMMYMRVTATRSDGRVYDNYHVYVNRFRDGKLVETQSIPVDQRMFEEFVAD